MIRHLSLVGLVTFIGSFNLLIAQDEFSDFEEEFVEEGEFVQEGEIIAISGSVIDAETGRALPGANVVVDGTDLGGAAD